MMMLMKVVVMVMMVMMVMTMIMIMMMKGVLVGVMTDVLLDNNDIGCVGNDVVVVVWQRL